MVGLYATVVGAATIVALVLVGVWLTWISLRDERHTPAPARSDAVDERE